MRRTTAFAPSSRPLALALGAFVSLCATTAVAAPTDVAPAPAPAPGTTTTTTQVSGPAGTPVVIVNNTVMPAPAPAPVVIPTAPARLQVDLHPQPVAAPTAAQLERSRLMADQSRAQGLRVGGWATAGGVYGFSALIGTIAIDSANDNRQRMYGGWMTVPVAGPFVAAFYSRTATGGLLTTTLGVAQAVGLGMAILGGHRYRQAKRRLMIAAAPTQGGGNVAVSMRF